MIIVASKEEILAELERERGARVAAARSMSGAAKAKQDGWAEALSWVHGLLERWREERPEDRDDQGDGAAGGRAGADQFMATYHQGGVNPQGGVTPG